MNSRNLPAILRIEGLVGQPLELTFAELDSWPSEDQIADVTRLGVKRPGTAVWLKAILRRAQSNSSATHLGLHASADNFHASIPLEAVVDRSLVIYAHDGQPLTSRDGGPFRFYIPEHAACQVDEIDECANVKFLDRLELTAGKGYDNRPQDEQEHAHRHAPSTSPRPS